MTDSNSLLATAQRVVARARGDEQIEAYAARSKSTEIRAHNGDVESLSSAESFGIGVRVLVEGRQGFAYAGSLESAAVDEALVAARDNAEFATVDPDLVMAQPDGVAAAELDLVDPSLGSFDVARKIELAIDLEARLRSIDEHISGVESSDYFDVFGEAALASTAGFAIESAATRAGLTAYALAADSDGITQTGFGWSVSRGPGELDPGTAAAAAAERATRLLGATKPQTGRTTVVLDPFVTAMFLGIVGSTFSGEAVNKGRSLFADRVGDEIAADLITLIDDPTDPAAYSASVFDGEGLASRRNVLIDGGRLVGFVHNASSAARAGVTSTASAIRGGHTSIPAVGCRALGLVPGDLDRDELYRSVGDGIVIQSVAGLHSGVNPVSGDFSTGAEGVRIRDGELAEPLREFTIGSTLQRMLLDTVAVGSDVELMPMSASGLSLAIAGVTVSGQ
ncbi:MAG: TldD/PmbA family protein [Actinomycetia bacterium]|nr:TldD/PmbA family protein [Actinomycetes bacterium]MCP4960959.1 TldD/PmbA family protein [Actinomycetes bacterium]